MGTETRTAAASSAFKEPFEPDTAAAAPLVTRSPLPWRGEPSAACRQRIVAPCLCCPCPPHAALGRNRGWAVQHECKYCIFLCGCGAPAVNVPLTGRWHRSPFHNPAWSLPEREASSKVWALKQGAWGWGEVAQGGLVLRGKQGQSTDQRLLHFQCRGLVLRSQAGACTGAGGGSATKTASLAPGAHRLFSVEKHPWVKPPGGTAVAPSEAQRRPLDPLHQPGGLEPLAPGSSSPGPSGEPRQTEPTTLWHAVGLPRPCPCPNSHSASSIFLLGRRRRRMMGRGLRTCHPPPFARYMLLGITCLQEHVGTGALPVPQWC